MTTMKKYRLIKTYPGSPALETILDFTPTYLSQFPEFWEEVVEKDYEIISYKYNGKVMICGGELNSTTIHLYTSNYIIHSIKRLSDGEVFTVGDRVDFKGYNIKTDTLTKITIRPYTPFDLRLWASYTKDYPEAYSIDRLTHKKQPLLTTEDGVDIYEDDEVWGITKDVWKPFYRIAKNTSNSVAVKEKWLHGKFSTKEAAEEYILMNKPCLSINDINNSWVIKHEKCGTKYVHGSKTLNKLIELVKSKLKTN